MEKLTKKSFAGLATAILTMACCGFASWGFHKSSDHATQVTFTSMAKFNNGDTIPAGTYRMEVAENSQSPKVTFSKDGKVIATEGAKLVGEQKKNDDTEIDSVTRGDTQLVTTIRPAGWNQELVFGSAGQQTSAAK
jgi:hypothetical protein